jgi:uncharacterized protein (UPF0332 family)
MNIDDLERQGFVRKFFKDSKKAKDLLRLADRDIELAKDIKSKNMDWSFTIAYNAMLQAGRALMFSEGYRPSGDKQHVSVIKFAETCLGREFSDIILMFDRMRRKRHIAIYDSAGTVSEKEVEQAINCAETFIKETKKLLDV